MHDTPPQPVSGDTGAGASPAVDSGARRWGVGVVVTVILVIALLLLGLLMPLPWHGRLASALGDLVHAPLFAVVALGCYKLLRRLGSKPAMAALIAWLLMTFFGAATEVVQGYVGRGESLQDAIDDTLGAAGGVLIGLGLEPATRKRRASAVALGLTLVLAAEVDSLLTLYDCFEQRRAMPLLASFEGSRELDRWWWDEAKLQRVAERATHGRWALRVDLYPGQYPGIVLVEPPPDWSKYQELVFDIDVEPAAATQSASQTAPLELIVKIEDLEHNGDYHDRFHRLLKLSPGRHEVRIPLAEVAAAPRGRKMNLQQIHVLQIFSLALPQPRTFYLDNVRLE